jgi:hypothetical protein
MVVLALVIATTFWGADDFFPFTPFRMYAFSAELDGVTNDTSVDAINEEGERFALNQELTGFRRAEVEGQMDRFHADPSLLRYLAEAYENANPDEPEIVTVEIVVLSHHLEDGKQTGEVTRTVEARWTREGADA